MSATPKLNQAAQGPSLVQGVNRLGLRGRPTMSPQIEEANPTWVGFESEWLPVGTGRSGTKQKEVPPAQGRFQSPLLARLAAGYQANEAPTESDAGAQGARGALGGAGVYEANMRVINGGPARNGTHLDVAY